MLPVLRTRRCALTLMRDVTRSRVATWTSASSPRFLSTQHHTMTRASPINRVADHAQAAYTFSTAPG
jgi:hypothetical protein